MTEPFKPKPPPSAYDPRLRLSSKALFAERSEVIIEHRGEEYRLRLTSNGKLILTK